MVVMRYRIHAVYAICVQKLGTKSRRLQPAQRKHRGIKSRADCWKRARVGPPICWMTTSARHDSDMLAKFILYSPPSPMIAGSVPTQRITERARERVGRHSKLAA